MVDQGKLKAILQSRRAEETYSLAQAAFISAMKSRDQVSIGKTARRLSVALEQLRCSRRPSACGTEAT